MKWRLSRPAISVAFLAVVSAGAALVFASDGMTVTLGTPLSITGPDGVCKKVTNGSATGLSEYIPTASSAEWQSFVNNPPAGVSLNSCSIAFSTVLAGEVSCGVAEDASGWCWGYNRYGQLGNGEAEDAVALVPAEIAGNYSWSQIVSGIGMTCGIQTDGSAWCWGRNNNGQLGNGGTTDSNVPVRVSGGGSWASISAANGHACGVKTNGTGWCWGNDGYGTLGNGGGGSSKVPVQVAGAWKSIDVKNNHACGIQTDGSAWCWGLAANGELGNGSTKNKPSPTRVSGTGTWIAIQTGNYHTCGLKSDGSAWCWGANSTGQMGDNSQYYNHTTPTAVSGGATWSALSVGGNAACALKADGTVWCWGYQYGDGTTVESLIPAKLPGSGSWTSVSMGASSACGTKADHTTWCWGSAGKLGTGSADASNVPVQVQDPQP